VCVPCTHKHANVFRISDDRICVRMCVYSFVCAHVYAYMYAYVLMCVHMCACVCVLVRGASTSYEAILPLICFSWTYFLDMRRVESVSIAFSVETHTFVTYKTTVASCHSFGWGLKVNCLPLHSPPLPFPLSPHALSLYHHAPGHLPRLPSLSCVNLEP